MPTSMYELITCFHEFCNYDSSSIFLKKLFVYFLRGNFFCLISNYEKNANVTVHVNKKDTMQSLKERKENFVEKIVDS